MSKQEEVLMNQNVAPEQFDWDSFESGLNAEDRKEKNEWTAFDLGGNCTSLFSCPKANEYIFFWHCSFL